MFIWWFVGIEAHFFGRPVRGGGPDPFKNDFIPIIKAIIPPINILSKLGTSNISKDNSILKLQYNPSDSIHLFLQPKTNTALTFATSNASKNCLENETRSIHHNHTAILLFLYVHLTLSFCGKSFSRDFLLTTYCLR